MYDRTAIICILSWLAGVVAPTGATTWYVAPGGSGSGTSASSSLGSINAAYQKATQGDVIQLAGGTYSGETINAKTITGWINNVVVRPTAGATATLDGTFNVNASRLTFDRLTLNSSLRLLSNVGHITVQNMQIRGTVQVATDHVRIAHNRFSGGDERDAIQIGAKFGAQRRSNDILIEHNDIRDYTNSLGGSNGNHEDGIQLFDTQNVVIRNNVISNMPNSNIIISVGQDFGVEHVRIENNFLRRTNANNSTVGFGTLGLLYKDLGSVEPTSLLKDVQVVNNTILADVHARDTSEIVFRNNIVDRYHLMPAGVVEDHNVVASRASGIVLDPTSILHALPPFLDAAGADFHISPSNTFNLAFGSSLLAPTTDYDGQLRTGPVWVGADQVVVPEPSVMGLSMATAFGLLLKRLRRRERSAVLGVALLAAGVSIPALAAESRAVKPVAVTASAQESKAAGGFGDFPPEKTIDGDLAANSSWRAEIKDEKVGQWIQYDLGATARVTAVQLAFVKGNERVYRFDVELSEDGKTWAAVFSGKSSGKDKGFETFDLKPTSGRYVRIRGFGNSSKDFANWINILEAQIHAN